MTASAPKAVFCALVKAILFSFLMHWYTPLTDASSLFSTKLLANTLQTISDSLLKPLIGQ